MTCLDENTVIEFVEGLLSAEEVARLEAHTAACSACRRLVSELAKSLSRPEPAPHTTSADAAVTSSYAALTRGALVGRYVVLATLGHGGMGVVYAAYDPELSRKVALKLLRGEAVGRSRERRGRLLREAQALARLSHPNVVAVHDVGTFGASVFLAMELVEGVTLGAWLAQSRRSWRAVVDVFVMAGRGLAAAHAEGLIHRDFKPANVLVGRDGRVRVADFGLARADDRRVDDDAVVTDPGGPPREITETGAVLGTPAYMAPEQFEPGVVDARADQFSFCVALFEALYGRRPFSLHTPEVLEAEAPKGKLPLVEAAAPVPAFLRRALERGLRAAPGERFPSMEALLAALSADPRRAWQRRASAALAIGAASALAFGLAQVGASARELCQGGAASFAEVWNDDARRGLREAFLATGAAYAADSWETVAHTLDAYARDWSAMHREACEATRVRGEQSDELLSLRMLCLDRRLAEVRTLTDLLADADRVGVAKAVQATAGLTDLAYCANLEALRSPVRAPEVGAAVAANDIETALTRARLLASLGRHDEALTEAKRATDRARALGHTPTTAAALETLGSIQLEAVDPRAAESSLREAYAAAQAGRHDRVAARAAIALVFVVGSQLFRATDGREWAYHARAALARWGPDPALEGWLHANVGSLRMNAGDFAAARAEYETSLAIREQAFGPEHRSVVQSLDLVIMAARAQGDHAAAREHLRRAADLSRRTFGAKHPAYGAILRQVGAQHLAEDRAGEAEAAFAEALAITEAARGRDHPQVGMILLNRSEALRELGERPAALAAAKRALAIFEATEGARPFVADGLMLLGDAENELGRFDAALAAHRRALAIYREVFGAEHDQVASSLARLGDVLLRQGKAREALDHHTQALALREKLNGPDFIDNADVLAGIGEAQVELGSPALAIPALERAQALLERHAAAPSLLARVRFQLARALWDSGQRDERALAAAARAEDGFRSLATPVALAEADRVRAWLASRG